MVVTRKCMFKLDLKGFAPKNRTSNDEKRHRIGIRYLQPYRSQQHNFRIGCQVLLTRGLGEEIEICVLITEMTNKDILKL